MKKAHYLSGCIISIFIVLHITNHLIALSGIENHLQIMHILRKVYRHPIMEMLLLSAIFFQGFSGWKLFRRTQDAKGFFMNVQRYSGLYLAIFFLFHIGAILAGRYVFQLDTNFYFGAAGLNTFPYLLFFIPYYFLAIVSFFGHLAGIHAQKAVKWVGVKKAKNQAIVIFVIGISVAIGVLAAMTDNFKGIDIPEEYLKIFAIP